MSSAFLCSALMFFCAGVSQLLGQEPAVVFAQPRLSTDTVSTEIEDAVIWIHPTDPSKSLLIGTDSGTYPNGGIFVWNLDGTQQQRITVNYPKHVDARYGMPLGGQFVDIAVVTMRDHNQLRAFKIDPETRSLIDVTTADGINLTSPDGMDPFSDPYGLGLYKRPSDGALFAFVSSREVAFEKGVLQVRLDDDGNGRVKGTQIRILGANNAFVDGIVVDDVLGYVYIAEEDVGIHKHNADPEKNGEQLAFFAREDGIVGRRAGLALYSCTDSTGYILLSNPGSESIKIYRREGEGGDPHRHDLLATIHNANGGDGDGLDVTNYSASASFANGLLMWQNRSENRFDLFAWEDIATTSLTICSRARPTSVEVGLLESPYPGAISLQPNYPNPFNPETKIRFVLNTPKRVLVHVFDLSGKKVRVLLDDVVGPGSHNINWNGRDDSGRPTASGIYFCQLLSDGFSETRPMVLLK